MGTCTSKKPQATPQYNFNQKVIVSPEVEEPKVIISRGVEELMLADKACDAIKKCAKDNEIIIEYAETKLKNIPLKDVNVAHRLTKADLESACREDEWQSIVMKHCNCHHGLIPNRIKKVPGDGNNYSVDCSNPTPNSSPRSTPRSGSGLEISHSHIVTDDSTTPHLSSQQQQMVSLKVCFEITGGFIGIVVIIYFIYKYCRMSMWRKDRTEKDNTETSALISEEKDLGDTLKDIDSLEKGTVTYNSLK